MNTNQILRQRSWSEQELIHAGFSYYQRRRLVVLARELPPQEAPLKIPFQNEILVATAGYMICFEAGERKRRSLYDYFHWPVAPDHFADICVEWTDPAWKPKRGQKHLMSLGCRPFVNVVGVWAKRLVHPETIQGVEHGGPVEAPSGAWLLLGAKGSALGAPYWVTDEGFRARYIVD